MSAMRELEVNDNGALREAIVALGLQTASPSIASKEGGGALASALEHLLEMMLKWNRVYNLTAITDRKQMVTHHLIDSLTIVPSLDRLFVGHDHPRLLDVGSGAGLPGIPLAVARPAWQLTLVDSSSKKTAFMTQATVELGLSNVAVITGRVEQQQRQEARVHDYDAITSRAFASLSGFVTGTRHLLAQDGVWVAMKGAVPQAEIDALPDDIACTAIVPLDVPGLDAERHLILMKAKR